MGLRQNVEAIQAGVLATAKTDNERSQIQAAFKIALDVADLMERFVSAAERQATALEEINEAYRHRR